MIAEVPPPDILPVFPLTGVLLLPGMDLPLHIFEQRYRNLVGDAMESHGQMGLIQPVLPRQDNRPLPGSEMEIPALYPVGCLGKITTCQKFPDGRIFIVLKGIARFHRGQELPLLKGYRRVRTRYDAEPEDAPPLDDSVAAGLIAALTRQAASPPVGLAPNQLEQLSTPVLVNFLAMALPFAPAEKQALLEARTMPERAGLLKILLAMPPSSQSGEDNLTPPKVN